MERGQFIAYQVHVFFPVYLLTNQNVNATTQQLRMVLSPIHVFMSRRHKMCFALISSEPAYDRTFGCPLRISRRATERDNGICWSCLNRRCFVGGVGRWSVMARSE